MNKNEHKMHIDFLLDSEIVLILQSITHTIESLKVSDMESMYFNNSDFFEILDRLRVLEIRFSLHANDSVYKIEDKPLYQGLINYCLFNKKTIDKQSTIV